MTLMKWGKALALLTLIVSTVGCDRVTKHFARTSLEGMPVQSLFGDIVRLDYTENTGGFLSLGATLPAPTRAAIFIVGTGLILISLAVVAVILRWHPSQLVGICLAFAGGASNLFDRVTHGAVIDFLNVGLGDHLRTGIFNVADVAIMLGICIALLRIHDAGPSNTL
jgi:signal peptidase II